MQEPYRSSIGALQEKEHYRSSTGALQEEQTGEGKGRGGWGGVGTRSACVSQLFLIISSLYNNSSAEPIALLSRKTLGSTTAQHMPTAEQKTIK